MVKVNKLNQVAYNKVVRLFEQEQNKLALELSKVLLEKARQLKDIESEKKALEIISFTSYYLADYIITMTYITQYSQIIEEEGTARELIKVYNMYSGLYIRQNEFKEAKAVLKKARELAIENDFNIELIKIENNYGYLYNTSGDYETAQVYLEKAIDMARLYHYSSIDLLIFSNLAVSYLKTGKLEESKDILKKVFLLLELDRNKLVQAEVYMYRGEILSREGCYEAALNEVNKSREIAEKNGYTVELAKATKIIADIYSAMENYRLACLELEKYIKLVEVLSEYNKQGTIIKFKRHYDYKKKELEADILRKQNMILERSNHKIQEQARELERLNNVLGKQNDDLHQSAIEDYLTGVYNRKYFTLKMREEFLLAKEHNQYVACIIFDIDKFKTVNDTYGHLIGDEVIKHISNICEESLDTDSIIGRFGGDEFMVLMVDSTIDDAEDKGNELNSNIRQSPLIIEGKTIHVTLSIGISDNHFMSPETIDDMINYADKGLYIAKEQGRNRCCRYKK